MEDIYLQVENNPSLVREKSTRAVINTDDEAYYKYMEKKAHLSKKDEEIKNLKHEVEDLKQMVEKLITNGALNHK